MPATPGGVFADAVRHFWSTRESQARRQRERGGSDQGTRSAVTGGKQMDGFITSRADWADRPIPYREPAADLSATKFIANLVRHVSSYYR